MSKLIVIYHSTYGHTKLQAEAVQKGAASINGMETDIMTAEEAIAKIDELDNADAMNTLEGPGSGTLNRLGSFIGPMAASFQVNPPDAPSKGDIDTAEAYGKRVAEITMKFNA